MLPDSRWLCSPTCGSQSHALPEPSRWHGSLARRHPWSQRDAVFSIWHPRCRRVGFSISAWLRKATCSDLKWLQPQACHRCEQERWMAGSLASCWPPASPCDVLANGPLPRAPQETGRSWNKKPCQVPLHAIPFAEPQGLDKTPHSI